MEPNNFRSLSESARKVLSREGTCSPTSGQIQKFITEQGAGITQPSINQLLNVIDHWGQPCGGPWCGDYNGDGVVDVNDLLWVIQNWNTPPEDPEGAQAPTGAPKFGLQGRVPSAPRRGAPPNTWLTRPIIN